MNRTEVLDLCEEYLHQLWCMEDMKDGGIRGFCLAYHDKYSFLNHHLPY